MTLDRFCVAAGVVVLRLSTRAAAGALAGVLAIGCAGRSPTAATTAASLAMRLGESQSVVGGEAAVTLYRVDNDSRCPVDVTCVSAGNAVVVFGLSTTSCPTCLPAQQFVNTTAEPRSVEVGGYRVRLDSLLPAAHSGQVIAQRDYVAYVTVSRTSKN